MTHLIHWVPVRPLQSHPREEHLIPLMGAAGAAGDDPGHVSFSDWVMGAKVSSFVFGA